MKKIFAGTFYWAALLNPKDQWHQQTNETRRKLGKINLVTTETVLIELLNFFSEYGAEMRQTVVDTVRDILVDLDIEYVPHSPETFLRRARLLRIAFRQRLQLNDCVSMLTMKNLNLREILTHDNHFEQEGYKILL